MRITIDIPDSLFRRLEARAAKAGIEVHALLIQLIEGRLNEADSRSEPKVRMRSPLPVIRPATGNPIPSRTNAQIDEIFLAEDLEHYLKLIGSSRDKSQESAP